MIIVNQDKTEIINFDNTLNIALYEDDENGWEIYAGMKAPDDNYRTLGYYKTKERAKEVLLEIMRAVSIKQLENEKVNKFEMEMVVKIIPISIYEMPIE